MGQLNGVRGAESPQTPLESHAVASSDEESEEDAPQSKLMSYSTENSHLLDAAPGKFFMSIPEPSHRGDLSLQKEQSERDAWGELLSKPPGPLRFLSDSLEAPAPAFRASSLFGALHHAQAFDSRNQAHRDLQSLTLSIPSLDDLPPQDLLELAAKGRWDESTPPPRERCSASPAKESSASPRGNPGLQAGKEGAKDSLPPDQSLKTDEENVLARWTRAAQEPSAGPIKHSWELAESSRKKEDGGVEGFRQLRLRPGQLNTGAFVSEGGVAIFDQLYGQYASKALHQAPSVVQESELVRDALLALQGVPSSLLRPESRAMVATKHAPRFRLQSTSPSSIAALLQPLIQAGSLRLQLEQIANAATGPQDSTLAKAPSQGLVLQAFGKALQTILLCQTASLDRVSASVRQRRSQERPQTFRSDAGAQQKDVEGHAQELVAKKESEPFQPQGASRFLTDETVGRRRMKLELLFGTADTVEKKDASTDLILADRKAGTREELVAAVNGALRNEPVDRKTASKETGQEERALESSKAVQNGVDKYQKSSGGTVTANAMNGMTLLELLLHSNELHTQLRVVGRLCARLGGFGHEGEGLGGAALLSKLFSEVQDADPAYIDLHQFLLSAACQPYLELLRGWLYQQHVDDPYHEFILEQSDDIDPSTGMKVFRAADPPSFLADVWQPLIRAGQQLRVLLDLPQTREIAESILSRCDWGVASNAQNPSKEPELQNSLENTIDVKKFNVNEGSPGLIFSRKKLKEIAKEGQEKARKKESEAGWALTMLAMQELRRKEGKIDVIEQHRTELAKAYEEQRRASVLEKENEATTKAELLRAQREELATREEAKRKAKEARIERERAMLREEKAQEEAEIERVKAVMIAEAEERWKVLDGEIQAARERTAAIEAPTSDVPAANPAEKPSAESQGVNADAPADRLATQDVNEEQSNAPQRAGSNRSDAQPATSSLGELQLLTGRERAAEGGHDKIDLEEWSRLADYETSEAGLFGEVQSESSFEEASDQQGSKTGEEEGSVRRLEEKEEDSPSVLSSLLNLIPGLGGRQDPKEEKEQSGSENDEGLEQEGVVDGDRSSEGETADEQSENESEATEDIEADFSDAQSQLDTAGAETHAGEETGQRAAEKESSADLRSDLPSKSKWGHVRNPALAAGMARDGLESETDARSAAQKGREIEGREMRDVFQGFGVLNEEEESKNGIDFGQSLTLKRWGLSGDPFAAAGMSTKALGDSFAAQDFRFVGGIDFRDPKRAADSSGVVKSETLEADDMNDWDLQEGDQIEVGELIGSEPSQGALAFLSPIPSASGPGHDLDYPTVAFCSPVASTGHDLDHPTVAFPSPVVSTGQQGFPLSDSPESPKQRPLLPPESPIAKSEPSSKNDSDAPLSVVVDVCIVQEILAQYRCVSLCCVRVFQEELQLPAHCAALRRYLFMLAGDFADAFVSALMAQRWGPSGGASRQAEVQALLEGALQISSCSNDRLAERLHVRVEQPQEELQDFYAPWVKASLIPGGFVNLARVDAFDFIQLEYRVDWPLNLVLTSAAMAQYQAVFRFLLRTKHAAFSLRDAWRDLQDLSRQLSKRAPGVSVHVFREQQQQLRDIQLFRQAISHVVTTLASFVQAQLLDVAWTRYQERVRNEVVDIHDLRQVHSEYLADATRHCLLSEEDAGAKACIDAIFQQLLDFRKHLRRAAHAVEQPAAELEIDEVNEQIKKTKVAFQGSFHTLYARHLLPRVQNDPVIRDLCMRLNFNGFVEASIAGWERLR